MSVPIPIIALKDGRDRRGDFSRLDKRQGQEDMGIRRIGLFSCQNIEKGESFLPVQEIMFIFAPSKTGWGEVKRYGCFSFSLPDFQNQRKWSIISVLTMKKEGLTASGNWPGESCRQRPW